MRVIEKKEPEKDFKYEHACEECGSRLEVESIDLIRIPPSISPRGSVAETFGTTCAVCHHQFDVPTDKIPQLVQRIARYRQTSGQDQDPKDNED